MVKLIEAKKPKAKILSKIQSKIKDTIPKCYRAAIWKFVFFLKNFIIMLKNFLIFFIVC